MVFFLTPCTELQGLTPLEADAESSFPLHTAHDMCETPAAQPQSQPFPSLTPELQLLHLAKILEKAWLHILTLWLRLISVYTLVSWRMMMTSSYIDK